MSSWQDISRDAGHRTQGKGVQDVGPGPVRASDFGLAAATQALFPLPVRARLGTKDIEAYKATWASFADGRGDAVSCEEWSEAASWWGRGASSEGLGQGGLGFNPSISGSHKLCSTH